MATYSGTIAESIDYGTKWDMSITSTPVLVVAVRDTLTASFFDNNIAFCGPVVSNGYTAVAPKTFVSKMSDNYCMDTVRGSIYWDLWIVNEYITEDTGYILTVWNSNEEIKVVSNIIVDSPDGVSLDPDHFPQGWARDWYYKYIYTVYNIGPAVQDSTYTFTVGAETFETHITGLRILPFILPINWDDGYKLTLLHNTIIDKNKFGREQRRSLQTRTFKNIEVTVVLDTVSKQDYFQNWLVFAQNKLLAMPLYQEAMFVSSDITIGQDTFIVQEAIVNYKFLNEVSFILIVNHVTMEGEIKKISSINTGTKTIVTTQTSLTAFDYESVVIYPVIFVTLGSIKKNNKTNSVSSVNITFREFKKEV